MPSTTRTSESDATHAIAHELALMQKAFTRKDLTGDDLLQAFQDLDPHQKGYISSKSDVIDVLCDVISTKYQRRIDFDLIVSSFKTKNRRFDYTAFCSAFEQVRIKKLASAKALPGSPTKRPPPASSTTKSPLKSPQKRTNWLIEQQQQPTMDLDDGNESSQRDADFTNLPMRVDQRLETQRLLTQSIRSKLLRGLIGARYNGFLGIQEALFHVDESGDGYLDEDVFEKQVLARLNKPLTKQETQFLLANTRIRSASGAARPVIDYEQVASICNLDSDASADETEEDDHDHHHHHQNNMGFSSTGPLSPQIRRRESKTADDSSTALGGAPSQLGADFLAAEKRLRLVLRLPQAQSTRSSSPTADETPRSVVTGAELFLEQAEALDKANSGLLYDHEFHRILNRCHVDISLGLVRSILSRFTWSSDGKISYRSFLERYGENPQLARERRKLKRFLSSLLIMVSVPIDEWLQFMAQRFDKYDTRLHERKRGDVPADEFISVLRGASGMVKLSVDDAAAVLALYLRVSTASSPTAVLYGEFLRILRDCHEQATTQAPAASDAENTQHKGLHSGSDAAFPITDVANYLIHHATEQERRHFEELMDALHKFQQRISSSASAASTSSPQDGANPHTPVTPAGSGSRTDARAAPPKTDATNDRGNQHGAHTDAPDGPQQPGDAVAGALTPVENGICMVLGANLHVRIQFATLPAVRT